METRGTVLTDDAITTQTAGGRARPSIALQGLGVALIIASVAAMVASLMSSRDRSQISGLGIGLLIVAPMLLFGTRFSLRPAVEWDGTQVTVVNPFMKRTIPWSDIEQVISGEFCLGFRLRNGRKARAWAIQRANASAPGKSRVDRVAAMLEEFRVSGSSGATAATGTRKIEIPWPELVVLAIYAAALTWHVLR